MSFFASLFPTNSSFAKLRQQFGRFLVSGGLATAVHWLVFVSLLGLSISPLTATSIGAVSGALVNYFLQHHWVFSQGRSYQKTALSFALTALLSFAMNALVFSLLMQIPAITPLWAQLITTAGVTMMNFILYKKVVFYEVPRTKSL